MHSLEDVERTLSAFGEVSAKLKDGYYKENLFQPA